MSVDVSSLHAYQEQGSERPQSLENGPTGPRGNLEVRPQEIQVLADGQRVGFTVREFQVFMVLAERDDHVVRRAEIYARVWGGEMKERDRSVDVFVRKVRNKLAQISPGWTYIHTHFGIGYRFAAVPPTESHRNADHSAQHGCADASID